MELGGRRVGLAVQFLWHDREKSQTVYRAMRYASTVPPNLTVLNLATPCAFGANTSALESWSSSSLGRQLTHVHDTSHVLGAAKGPELI